MNNKQFGHIKNAPSTTKRLSRVFAMPNKRTFQIKPIKQLIKKYTPAAANILDLFSYPFDIDALEKCKLWPNESADLVLFDPVYSGRQLKENYEGKGNFYGGCYMEYYSKLFKEIHRILKPGGIALTFGWNSRRVSSGFEFIEIMLVSHGGNHNDTICTAQMKVNQTLEAHFEG